MNKKLKRLVVLILVLCFFVFSGCSLEDFIGTHSKKLSSIKIDRSTLKEEYVIGEIDFSSIKISLTYSDGTIETVPFSADYVLDSEVLKLNSEGNKDIYFEYEGFYSFFSINLVKTEEHGGNDDPDIDPPVIIDNPPEKGDAVYLFSINDTHGSLITDSSTSTVGLDKVTTIINSFTDDHILIANGDIFQGSYISNTLRGRPAVEWMNYMEFDCFVLGNHEFDWGLEEIYAYKDGDPSNGEANFPFLGCNIYYSSDLTRVEWVDPYVIVENNGYKVGIIGAIGEDYTDSIIASIANNYRFVDPVPLIKEYAKELRSKKDCDVVIVSIHAYETYTNNRIADLSGESRIDAIVCGHTHYDEEDYLTRADGYKIPVIESRSNNYSVGSIKLTMTNDLASSGKVTHYTPSNYASNTAAYNLLKTFADQVEADGNRVIGYTSKTLYKDQVGPWMCDAAREYYNCDYAIVNTGGVRASINSGEITYADVFKVFPFDNTFVICQMTGSQLKYYDNGYCYFDNSYSSSSISNSKTYTVAIVNYEFENYEGRSHCISFEYQNEPIRDIFARWISANYPAN